MWTLRRGVLAALGLAFVTVACQLFTTCQASPVRGDVMGGGLLQLRKRPFVEANCRGAYAPHFDGLVHRLDRMCRECADMFPTMRDFIQDGCHSECYRNEIFQSCLTASMTDTDEVNQMIGQLSGK